MMQWTGVEQDFEPPSRNKQTRLPQHNYGHYTLTTTARSRNVDTNTEGKHRLVITDSSCALVDSVLL